MTNHYHFITRWRVRGTVDEVFDILSQPVEYSRWWPSVYLMVSEMARGGSDGGGTRIRFLTKGWLPYKLNWEASITESRRPNRIALQAYGDFEGRGIWSCVPDGDFTDITFDWRLIARKPLLRYLSPLLRPAFEANHRWAMAQGLRSLELELARARARTVEEMNAVAQPAGAAELWNRAIAAGALLAAGVIAGLVKTHGSSAPRAS